MFSGVLPCSSSLLGALMCREKSCAACTVLDCFHASSKDAVTKQSLRKHKFDQEGNRINMKRKGRNGHRTNHVNSSISDFGKSSALVSTKYVVDYMGASLKPCSHPAPSLYHFLPFAVSSLTCWKLFSEVVQHNIYT